MSPPPRLAVVRPTDVLCARCHEWRRRRHRIADCNPAVDCHADRRRRRRFHAHPHVVVARAGDREEVAGVPSAIEREIGATRGGADVTGAANPGEVIGYLREHEITLTWNPASAALQARGTETARTVTIKAS